MKNTVKSIVLLLVTLSAVASAFAGTAKEAEIQSKDQRLVLNPSKIVQPRILDHEVGEVVQLRFTVTPEGKTANIESLSVERNGRHLSERVVQAVRAWEFKPVLDPQGEAQAVTVEMPLTIRDIEHF